MSDEGQRPEWAPNDGGEGFHSQVRKGVNVNPRRAAIRRRSSLEIDDYVKGILAGDRTILARAITLVESNRAEHQEQAAELLRQLQSTAGGAIRVGITGVPGAGKSTTIEALGVKLCRLGHKVAVLAVDPSSTRTGGSILGDKTRMELLSREPAAFIRPSPSGGTLGGVARKTRETMTLCEAAGFDVLLVETVGVGQSEITVRSMVDFFLLVLISGAGDDLQGIKKGVIEIADAIVVNKADGDNIPRAKAARAELRQVLHYLQDATEGWKTPALTASALTGDGIDEIWQTVLKFRETAQANGVWERRRREQDVDWMRELIKEALEHRFYRNPAVQSRLPDLERAVIAGKVPPASAVMELLKLFEG